MTSTTSVEMYPTSAPDATGDCGDEDHAHQLAPEAEEIDAEEDGYGYGV